MCLIHMQCCRIYHLFESTTGNKLQLVISRKVKYMATWLVIVGRWKQTSSGAAAHGQAENGRNTQNN